MNCSKFKDSVSNIYLGAAVVEIHCNDKNIYILCRLLLACKGIMVHSRKDDPFYSDDL